MTSEEFDARVIEQGDAYDSDEEYSAWFGPNSNTAADNIIEGAGGTVPDVEDVWHQNYDE